MSAIRARVCAVTADDPERARLTVDGLTPASLAISTIVTFKVDRAACPVDFSLVTSGQRYRLKENERFPDDLANSFGLLLNHIDIRCDDQVSHDSGVFCPLVGIQTLIGNDAIDPFDRRRSVDCPAAKSTAVDHEGCFD